MNRIKDILTMSNYHIVKRNDIVWWKAWTIRCVAIVLALILCILSLVLLTDMSFGKIFTTMFKSVFGKSFFLWDFAQRTAILLCIALAITPAFKMKFWNIGAEGQVLMGGLATGACMVLFGDKISYPLLIAMMIAASILAGAVWGLIPAIFKVTVNANETLFTLMMNYVATQIVAYFTLIWSVPKGSGTPRDLGEWALPVLYKTELGNILIVALITIAMYLYLRYSKQGYEVSVVGESENTARYIGINVKKVVLRTMVISGALCGIAGLLLVGGIDHSFKAETAGGRGFTAIMVSWLAKFNPFMMIFTSMLVIFLQMGTVKITDTARINSSYAEIVTGLVIFFIIGSEFFINYSVKRSVRNNVEVAE